ncbi:hypothetical protein CHS0354_034358 [Potamilus streckersoni]|uniref:Uncharacterized protein n=1 Tax=Potamilus streckersoni TaxID=2493646 RepID=A0AAE0TLC2_9BIVA|nr:hypothetical protein CHS0354_034358 [Potamilus streckersoni]
MVRVLLSVMVPILGDILKLSMASKSDKPVSSIISDVCMPRDSDRIVYRSKNATNVYVGFDSVEIGIVHFMQWALEGENILPRGKGEYDSVQSVNFRDKITQPHILAAAGKDVERGFKQKMVSCWRVPCSIDKLMNVLAEYSLQMKEISFKPGCLKRLK